MKLRKFGILLLLVAITAILAVSCNSEVADGSVANANPGNELVYATFGNSSKAIAVDSVVGYKPYGELYWFYTAEKMDGYGRTGQQLSPVPVMGQSETAHTPGLDGKTVGPFSQGVWSFTLYAYDTAEKTTLYYEGTNPSVELRANQQNNIPVTVEPQGTTGKISFKDAWYEWDVFGTEDVNLTITLTSSDNTVYNCTTKTLEKSGDKYPITGYITYGEPSALIASFPAGIYTAQFKVVSIPANANSEPYEFVSQPLAFRVYGNLETQLTGNLVEGLFATGYFTVPEQQINVFVAEVIGETVQKVEQQVAIAPAKTDAGDNQTTNITFPSGSITSEQHSLKVEVTNMADASSKFDVTGDDTAVAGIDLQLMKITTTDTTTTEVPVTDFVKNRGKEGQEVHYVTIETYIAKGFNEVTVVYNGNTPGFEQPVANNSETPSNVAEVFTSDSAMGETSLGYSQESGKLRFKTTHFSEFYVKSDVQALNVTTNTVYISLTSAIEGASAGDEIRLLKNVELSDQLWIGKKLTLDLNGKTVSLNKGTNESIHTNGVIGVLRGGDVTIKDSGTNGAIDGTVGTKAFCGIGVTKLGETGDAKAKLTVESGIIKGYYYGISGNGNRHNTEITINGGTIEGGCAASEGGTGIYHPQDGTLIITGGAVSGTDAAVELRSGSANVTGGTFTATKAPTAYVANGNGTTTSGVAFAVAQHTTQKAIDVKILGGTFTGNTAFSYMNPENNDTTNTSVVISGGTFTSTATGSAVAVESVYTEFLKGGTYNVEPELKFIKKGYEAVPATSTGPWTVQEGSPSDAVAKLIDINGNIYFFKDLQKAVNTAETGETVVLLRDVTINRALLIDKGIVFDGSLHTIRKTTSGQNHTDTNIDDRFLINIRTSENVTVKNVTIKNICTVSGSGRGIVISSLFSDVNLLLDNTTIIANERGVQLWYDSLPNTTQSLITINNCEFYRLGFEKDASPRRNYLTDVQSMTHGIMLNCTKNVKISMNNTNFYGFGYGICANYYNGNGTSEYDQIIVDGCKFYGRSAMDLISLKNSNVSVSNSFIRGINIFAGPTEKFGNIVLGDSSVGTGCCSNVTIAIDNCDFEVYRSPAAYHNFQGAVDIRENSNTVTLTGTNRLVGYVYYNNNPDYPYCPTTQAEFNATGSSAFNHYSSITLNIVGEFSSSVCNCYISGTETSYRFDWPMQSE